jgi:ATP synthase F1 gamma subunit
MKTLPSIKKDLEFNSSLSALIEVLKNIAVSQFHTLEQKLKSYEKFFLVNDSFFEFIDISRIEHPFLIPKNKSQMVVAITSDSGLLGGLNMQVVATAIRELEKIPGKLVVIGERGKIYARESGIPFVAFSGIEDEERYAQAIQLRDYLINKVFADSIGYLKIVYPYPVSFTVQRVETVSVLPYTPTSFEKLKSSQIPADIITESAMGDIVQYLVYLWLGQKFYEVFGLSRLAEFAARYVHLQDCAQKLKEMDKKLRLQYFRVRHELIDRNMRELFSARLLYAS